MKIDRGRPTAFILTHESTPQRTRKGTSIIALALTRSLGRQGVPVVRVHPNRMDLSLSSRYCRGVEISPDFYADEQGLLRFLLDMRQRYAGGAVLIPASDDCAHFVSKHRDALQGAFAVMAPPWAVTRVILDKRSQYEQARRLGIPIPETYFPADMDELRRLAPQLANYPYVIKPLVAHKWRLASAGSQVRGHKGFAAANPEELAERYRMVSAADRDVMVQEVVGGADDQLFTFLSYCNERSEPLCYCIRRKLRQFPLDFGYCTLTESCVDPVVQDQSIRLLRGIGFHGISGIEWKRDPRSGAYKLIEINARAVNTIGMGGACGVDIPYLAYRDKAEGVATRVTEWRSGARWINLSDDFWAARSLHRQGKLSLGAWARSVARCRTDAIFAADDLRPFVPHVLAFLKSSVAAIGRWVIRARKTAGSPTAI